MSIETITVGPSGGNECCICCNTGCIENNRCCTCPPTGNLLICFPAPGCCEAGYTGLEITLVPSQGACSSGTFSTRHGNLCDHDQSYSGEEWSAGTQQLCASGDCGGECVNIDFCCCNNYLNSGVDLAQGNCNCDSYVLGWTHTDSCYGSNVVCACPTGTEIDPIEPDVNMENPKGNLCQCMDNVTGDMPFFFSFTLDYDTYQCDCCDDLSGTCGTISGLIVEDADDCTTGLGV